EKAVHDAEQFAEADKKRREEVELRNSAESMLYSAEKTKEELKDKISADQASAIDKAAAALRTPLAGKENDKIKTASDDLTKALQKVGQEIYEKVAQQQAAQGAQGKASATPPPSGAPGDADPSGDNVMDAEYREVKDEGS